MTEVPCAFTVEDCIRLVRCVKKTGCIYQLAEQTRYMHFISEWRKMYQADSFGAMLVMEGEYLHYEKWDNYADLETGELFYNKDTLEGPSYTGDAANQTSTPASQRKLSPTWRFRCMAHPILYLPHELSPLLSVTEDRVTHVSCMGTPLGSFSDPEVYPETRDMESALMHTVKGTVLRLSAGFTTPHGHRSGTGCHWYHAMGSKMSAEWTRNDTDPPRYWKPGEGWRKADWQVLDPDAPEAAKITGHGGLDWYPLNEFVGAINEKREPWMNVYRAADTALSAILAAKSADEGGVLMEVPDPRNF
jgi:predicted dehydrogenase